MPRRIGHEEDGASVGLRLGALGDQHSQPGEAGDGRLLPQPNDLLVDRVAELPVDEAGADNVDDGQDDRRRQAEQPR